MILRKQSLLGAFTAFMAAGTLLMPPSASAQAAEEDVQVLTRGPVHEAFAESVNFDPEPGIIISTRIPDPIEEMPPEQQLEGENVTWISGYWAWDDDQNDFIWISGIWRNLPPGRQWVPGYWNEIDGGKYQWTSGYWADSTTSEVEYVSTAPPRNIDVGPNTEAPSENHNWIPGNWYWSETRYVWRPGYWVPLRTNWTWVPSRYCWSHRGYVYVDGYWDYAVAGRGVLFAPLYFRQHVYTRPDYFYTPSIVVALNVFSDHLFVRPRCGHYYFGDYYAPRYRDSGFYASFSWHSGHRGYDPIYAYDRWDHRGDRNWERQRRDNYNYFRDNEDSRPPRTWAAMRDSRDDRFNDGRNRKYASPLSGFAKNNKSGQRFRTLDEGRRKEFVSQRQEMRKFSQERRQSESRGMVAGDGAKKTASREKLTRSPIVGREAERFAKNEGPPKRPESRGDKIRVIPAGKNKVQAGDSRKGESGVADKRHDAAKANERGVTPRDDKARAGGKSVAPEQKRDGKSNGDSRKADSPTPRREAGSVREFPKRKAEERQAQPKADRPNTERKTQITPKREVQPKAQSRPAPERRPQVAPRREERPQPKAQQRPAPDRKQQAVPKRESQPKPQARQAPQRKQQIAPQREARPKPQARQATQPQSAPQRTEQSGRKGNKSSEDEITDKKRRGGKQ